MAITCDYSEYESSVLGAVLGSLLHQDHVHVLWLLEVVLAEGFRLIDPDAPTTKELGIQLFELADVVGGIARLSDLDRQFKVSKLELGEVFRVLGRAVGVLGTRHRPKSTCL